MADNLLSLKKRISTIESIKKITNAMKLIASSRYNKQKNLFESNKDYLLAMTNAMNTCISYVNYSKFKLPTCMIKNDSNKKLYIFITPTLGLCGSYYYNLDKLAKQYLDKESDVIFIGEKGYRHYKDKVNHSYKEFLDLLERLTFANTNYFRHYLDNLYITNKYEGIYIIYTKFINSLNVKATIEKILPLEYKINPQILKKEPRFEGKVENVADLLVPHYLDALLFHYLLESSLSEQASRKNSMENATKSADKLIDELNLKYNKIRQQNITNEITEIINGSNNSPLLF